MRPRRALLRLAGLLLTVVLSCARGAAAPMASRIPDTPAGRAFQRWLEAYNDGDSVRLEAYVRQYEPAMSVHTQLVFRQQTGRWDIASIARSEPTHLELVLRTRQDSVGQYNPLTMYAVMDVAGENGSHATTSFALIAKGALASSAELHRVGAGQRAATIDSIAAKLVRNYVFLDVANEIADSLRARQSRGAYDDYLTEASFGQRLNRDLRELGGDKQLGVEYAWNLPLPPPVPATPAMIHCGIEPVRMLDESVGYVRLYSFGDWGWWTCDHVMSEAMQAVAGARTLVLDLRENVDDIIFSDDSPDSREHMAYLASYLLAGCTHLDDAWDRRTGQTDQRWTRDDVPGPAFGGTKPLYVLTSAHTFGAGEELAYDLQSLGRATIVGEPTAGAAHVSAVGAVGEHLLVHAAIARIINPVTKTNWYRVGVEPNVPVPSSAALPVALRLIQRGRTSAHRASGSASRAVSFRLPALGRGGQAQLIRDVAGRGRKETLRPQQGIRFFVDTVVPYAAWGVLSRVAGVVEFANGRGRFDVTAVRHAPAVSLAGLTIAEPLARPGDYYLFDNTGFVLVRPGSHTFSSFAFTRADFNHTGQLLPGAVMMGPTYAGRIDTLAASAGPVQRQHAPISILWHAQPRGVQPPSFRTQGGLDFRMYGRGMLEIADAPAVEAGVARWFELAAALGTRGDSASALPSEGVDVTTIVSLHRPERRGKPVSLGEDLTPRHLATAEIDPSRLMLPAAYRETPWPGFEHASGVGGGSHTTATHWRALEDTTSQRARAACKQAWLPDPTGEASGDTGPTAVPRDRQTARP